MTIIPSNKAPVIMNRATIKNAVHKMFSVSENRIPKPKPLILNFFHSCVSSYNPMT